MKIDKEELERQRKNEENTKATYIMPIIKTRWGDGNFIMEFPITNGQVVVTGDTAKREKPLSADYLLLYNCDTPLAIVEAKGRDHDASEGYEQAINYAKKVEAPFAYATNGDDVIEEDFITGSNCTFKMTDFPSCENLWQRYVDEKQLSPEEISLIYQPKYEDTSSGTPKKARYYQKNAIRKVLEAVYNDQKRILLVMATGTGKTFVCFQIVWCMIHSGRAKKVLYLVDRTALADQTLAKDFKPFVNQDKAVLVDSAKMQENSAYDIHIALYQQVKNNGIQYYKQYAPDYFDLIIVDECHRGSADMNSEWHEILEYFSSAVQLGVTATPKETEDVSTQKYFGEPVYTYSLKQGIEDGFLAPFRLFKMDLDIDKTGYKPQKGEVDIDGKPLKNKVYTMHDFDRTMIVESRRELVAQKIHDFIRINRLEYEKAIIFCVDTAHASDMVLRLKNLFADIVCEHPDYIVEITSKTAEIGKQHLKNFTRANVQFPVIAVTSQLMSTGIDTETCKTIFLDKCIGSMTEFKQTIGRGTRLKEYYIDGEPHEKLFFNVVDFRKNYEKFKDKDFDGDPAIIYEGGGSKTKPNSSGGDGRQLFKVKGDQIDVTEKVVNLDENMEMVSENLYQQVKHNVLEQYPEICDLYKALGEAENKDQFLNELIISERLLHSVEKNFGFKMDKLDAILYASHGVQPKPKTERLQQLYDSDLFRSLEGDKQEVIRIILEQYLRQPFSALLETAAYKLKALENAGYTVTRIHRDIFNGSAEEYISLMLKFENILYKNGEN